VEWEANTDAFRGELSLLLLLLWGQTMMILMLGASRRQRVLLSRAFVNEYPSIRVVYCLFLGPHTGLMYWRNI